MKRDHGLVDKRIWLTGASSGIGRALAIELGRQGARLALSARNAAGLESVVREVKSAEVFAVPADLSTPEGNEAACAVLGERWGGLDIALFNAGTAEYVDIDRFDSAIFERLIRSNFLSMVYGIEAALPLLRQSDSPYIVGMSSTVAYSGIPRAEAYGASKAAVRNMLQALRAHLVPKHIDVSTVCPGFVRTPLTDKNDFPMPMLIEADAAARQIVAGMRRRQAEIHFPKLFSLTYKLLAALPAGLYTKLIANTVRQS